jgi:hypothetical protein
VPAFTAGALSAQPARVEKIELDEDAEQARASFEAKVSEIAKRDVIPRTQAMQKARCEHPELFAAFG